MQLVERPSIQGIREYRMLIGGDWVDSLSGKTFESTNPFTGRVWATVQEAGAEDVDRAVKAARHFLQALGEDLALAGGLVAEQLAHPNPQAHRHTAPGEVGQGAGVAAVDPA